MANMKTEFCGTGSEICKITLNFRGEEFIETWVVSGSGAKTLERGLDCQVKDRFFEDEEIDDIVCLINDLGFETDIIVIDELLRQLSDYE